MVWSGCGDVRCPQASSPPPPLLLLSHCIACVRAGPGRGPAALALYKRAARQGNWGALLRIGDSYWYGKGVERDWARAAQVGGVGGCAWWGGWGDWILSAAACGVIDAAASAKCQPVTAA